MNLRKILLLFILIFWMLFLFNSTFAKIELDNNLINFTDKIKEVSIDNWNFWSSQKNTVEQIEFLWVSLLKTFKVVIQGLLLLFIVYAWAMMIMSQWNDEEQLWSAKRYIWHAVVALIFINIPWTLYDSFIWQKGENISWTFWDFTEKSFWFINSNWFFNILENVIKFIQVIIFFVAVLLLSISAIKLIMSRWREEVMKEHKNNIFYSVLGLVFVWLINTWRNIVFDWAKLQKNATDFFHQMAEFVLLFAWPIAIFFLVMAWYYFITANWDEDRIKKWKSIIINVLIWTVILLMSYTFLLDIKGFELPK